MATGSRTDYRTHDHDEGMNEGAGKAEHTLAYLMAAVAIALGAIGLLVGFGIVGGEDVAAEGTATAGNTNFEDGLLWLLPSISAGLLAYALHRNDHHRATMQTSGAGEKAYGAEHMLAYLMAAAAIATGALGMLVGFDVFDQGNTAQDGYLWIVASILGGVLTGTLHAVRHHVYEDEAYIVSIIDRRSGMATRTANDPAVVRERESRPNA